jgi:PA domain
VRVQPVPFPFFRERSSRLSVDGERRAPGSGFLVLQYSGNGAVDGRTQKAGTGCSVSDFAGLSDGAVAVVSRGPCPFRVKAANAERAGARALLVSDPDGDPGEGSPTLGGLGVEIPVLLVLGDVRDGAPVRLAVRAAVGRRQSSNVIAETPGGGPGPVIMAGAHLDSVPAGSASGAPRRLA